MSHVIDAIYENGVLKPERPLPLKNQENVRITVERVATGSRSLLDIPPISLGAVLPATKIDDDVLGEMLEGRA